MTEKKKPTLDDVVEEFMSCAIEDFKDGDSLAVAAVDLIRRMSKRKHDIVVHTLADFLEGWLEAYRDDHPAHQKWGPDGVPVPLDVEEEGGAN